MATPKLTPGTLYSNRDRDYRTGEWGPYVKMGIVRHDRSAEDRAKEHQTGNPREVVSEHTLNAPMVEHLETQLHHRFAPYWVNGEWFEMSQEFVVDTVLPEAQRIIDEQSEFLSDFERAAELKRVQSSGVVREPTEEEQQVWEKWKAAKEAKTLAENKKLLIDLALRKAVGEGNGISGIVNLIVKPGKPAFRKKDFQAEHADVYAQFLVDKEPALKGSFLGKGALGIAKLDPDLSAQLKAAKADKVSFTEAHVADGVKPISRTAELKKQHAAFVESLGAVARADWDVERWAARLGRMVGEDDGLGKLVAWKREMKAQNPAFDQKAFKAAHPDLFEKFMKPTATTVSVGILPHRPYALE